MHRVYSSAAFITCQRLWCVRMCWGAGGTCLSLLCVMTGWSCSLSPNLNSAYSAVRLHAYCRTELQQIFWISYNVPFSHSYTLPTFLIFVFIYMWFVFYIASNILGFFLLCSSFLKSQGLLWLSALVFFTFTLFFSFCHLWSGLFLYVRHRDETELQNICKTVVI